MGLTYLSEHQDFSCIVSCKRIPLKDLEGHITRIDRRNKSGQVSITFGGKTIKIWLGFNYIEDRETKGNAFAAGETL